MTSSNLEQCSKLLSAKFKKKTTIKNKDHIKCSEM